MIDSFEFQQVRIKQVLFKSRLRSVLYGVRTAEPGLCALPTNQLYLWLESHLRPCHPTSSLLPQIELALRRMLNRGQGLMDEYARGRLEEARAGLTAIDVDAAEIDGLLRRLEQHPCEN